MTEYRVAQPSSSSLSQAASAAKAKRRAILQRVRKQRAIEQKRTLAEYIHAGDITRGSAVKEQHRDREEQ